MCYHRAQTRPECANIFALDSNDLEAMSLQGSGEIVALEIFRRVPCNGDVIVINQQLHIEPLGNCKASSLGVVAFLLGPIRAQAEDGFVSICQGDTIHEWPKGSEYMRPKLEFYKRTTYVPDAQRKT